MSDPHQSVWQGPWGDVLFGYMHEDPAVECTLAKNGQQVLCVLSAGDIAFTMAHEGCQVVAADVNAAQHRLLRLKLSAYRAGITVHDACGMTVSEILNRQEVHSAIQSAVDGPDDLAFWSNGGRGSRPLIAAGRIDSRLRFIARWVAPLIMNGRLPDEKVFGTHRWKLAWRGLALAVAVAFPAPFRRHLPSDFIQRFRCRFEASAREHPYATNLITRRMLNWQTTKDAACYAPTWPTSEGVLGIQATLGTIQDVGKSSGRIFDLISVSNILDTSPTEAWPALLEELKQITQPGSYVVLRSLFRDSADWPEPPDGWQVAEAVLYKAQALDTAPLCKVSVVVQRL